MGVVELSIIQYKKGVHINHSSQQRPPPPPAQHNRLINLEYVPNSITGSLAVMGNTSSASAEKLWLTLRKPTARNSYSLPQSRVRVVFVVGRKTKVRRAMLRRLRKGCKCALISATSLSGFRSSISAQDLAMLLRRAILHSRQGVCFM